VAVSCPLLFNRLFYEVFVINITRVSDIVQNGEDLLGRESQQRASCLCSAPLGCC